MTHQQWCGDTDYYDTCSKATILYNYYKTTKKQQEVQSLPPQFDRKHAGTRITRDQRQTCAQVEL